MQHLDQFSESVAGFWETRASTLLVIGLWVIGLALLAGTLWACGF